MSSTPAPNAAPSWLYPKAAELPKPGEILDGMDYSERLWHHTFATQDNDVHFLEYRVLHRLNIFDLQNQLAKLKGACWKDQKASEADLKKLKTTLHDYTTAIQDYAYMHSLQGVRSSQAPARRRDLSQAFPEIANLPGEPYNSHYCTLGSDPEFLSDPIRDYLKGVVPRHLAYSKPEMDLNMDGYLAKLPPETISPSVDRVTRFIIAFAGGAALVVPMLVMSLPSAHKTKSLITVSVAVTLFAATMSLAVRASNSETLVATATYAAVLVVFVGTSG
ncbi:hypothetical protein LTR91_009420 [Friedmanniomyces endolithicus]|uniref:DUF6594 domain-containing protein n=1 Tax=Friedmanniomyces endolithicus TaxID=329885 RepID=A0A4U0VH13_9PEZI|nr:hypothetical protein LTS09_005173 [Friedmanniomyces endolithicus]KAK0290524.1 hypothetical protein LTR35_002468 [Friedmanniomyces endolithicus]KAK0308907.1 hypothetical protein LTR01_004787 [Friedmanniomyces endolithicus]KAK0325744.1 hypothetical protein LTR82_003281 [Friedmanniomyces endolithicus]KAK0829920.1 hypothetical protein LTR73_004057 [Friedmanniomyces endolithicus]